MSGLFPESAGRDGLTKAQRTIADAMLERDLEEHVRDVCKQLRFLRYHTYRAKHSPAGFPDDVIVGPRDVLFRELKREKGKPTADQQEWLDRLGAVGCNVGLWRPSDWLTGRIQHELMALM